MWQGYGQMRAARIIARATIFSTGIVGAGLWCYQQQLKEKNKQLDDRDREIER